MRIKSVNLHVADLDRATAFWTAALGYETRGDSSALLPKNDAAPEIAGSGSCTRRPRPSTAV
ncbi:MAG: hypothetical protein ABW022_04870 [Actinoplanes sp.]